MAASVESSETRTKVAAAAASVIPFHCVICFDEFDSTQRPPMVLPCGHTYVCLPCTKRLKRCMECREPLFIPAPVHHKLTTLTNTRGSTPPIYNRGGRYSPLQQPPLTPPQSLVHISPPSPIPLPIPKNLVLLSMMEAAERHARVEFLDELAEEESQSEESDEEEEEDEEFDLNRIIGGMATLTGPCGTYAVKEEEGLAVIPYDPRKKSTLEEKTEAIEPAKEPFPLEKGQTVQVVDFSDGVAKLARGLGYIVATSSQLVKVGGPLDKSCHLEGICDTVISRGRDLQRTLDENMQIEASLQKQIEAEQEKEPSHPIVTEAPRPDELSVNRKDSDDTAPLTPGGVDGDLSQPVLQTPERDLSIPLAPSSESILEFDENGVAVYSPSPTYPRSPNSIDNSDLAGIPRYRRSSSDDDLQTLIFGCGSAFLGDGSELFGENLTPASELLTAAANHASGADFDSHASDISVESRPNRAASTDGVSFGHNTSPVLAPTSSFDGINFRTGMSGHRALMSSKSRAREGPRGQIRMMSEHRGIARARGQKSRASKGSPSYSPSFGPRFESVPGHVDSPYR